MAEYSIKLNEDEAIVLFEYFNRFDDTDSLAFEHAAEYLALQKLSGKINKTTSAIFKPNYIELLENARSRIADGFEGDVPGLKKGG